MNHDDKYKYKIGQIIKDNKKNITIIDREIRVRIKKTNNTSSGITNAHERYYKVKCNKCGYDEWWVVEYKLKNNNCPCCTSQVAVLGINTIYDKASWMIDLGVSEEDAKKYCPRSKKKVMVICPICKNQKISQLNDIYKSKSIGCKLCGDGISKPEKYMNNFLKQLNVDFKTQVKYDWNKYNNPITGKISQANIDFVIYYNGREIPIEVDGEFHRKDNNMQNTTKENQIYIDHIRDLNCLKYLGEDTIRISNKGDIKQNILNSKLSKIFDLSKIDWQECELASLNNLTKEVCDYWNNKEEYETTTNLSNIFNKNPSFIRDCLKKGNSLGLCSYNTKYETDKARKTKPVKIIKNNKIIYISKSINECVRYLNNKFNIKTTNGTIKNYIKNNKEYKNIKFEYATIDEYNIWSTKGE